jgi:sarcosine oxidase subunit beta
VELQRSLGVDSELLEADEVTRRWPNLADRGFRGASFRANDGWANHHRIIDGLVRGASAAGVEILTGTEALTLEMSGGRLAGISTTSERIAADAALLATGPWVEPLLGPLGLVVPVVGRRHELLIVDTSGSSSAGLPWLIDVEEQVHIRSDAPGRALVGGFLGEDRAADPDRYDRRAGPRWTELVLDRASRVFGVVAPDAHIRHGWAGLYPSTPDHHPIIDELADGLFVAVGFSGTGLMHAPAAGQLAAELIVGRRITSVDPAALSAGRFAQIGSAEATGF